MRRVIWALLLIVWAAQLVGTAQAEENGIEAALDALPLGDVQRLADEAGSGIDIRVLTKDLAENGAAARIQKLSDELKARVLSALRDAFPMLISLMAPALLWALGRQLTGGGRLGAASDLVCGLTGACMLAKMLIVRMDQARAAIERVAALTERFHPVMAAVLTTSGAPGAAGLMQPSGALAAGLMTGVMTRGVFALSGGAAIVCAAGCLSDRLKLDGLFKLMKTGANRLMGLSTTLFLGLMRAGGLIEFRRDSLTMRAAEFAVDKMLPVIGKNMSDTLNTAVSSVKVIGGAVGVSGAALAVALCLDPVIKAAVSVLACRLAAALTEPAADGPMCRLLRGFADAMQLLLLAQIACTALFLVIIGTAMRSW